MLFSEEMIKIVVEVYHRLVVVVTVAAVAEIIKIAAEITIIIIVITASIEEVGMIAILVDRDRGAVKGGDREVVRDPAKGAEGPAVVVAIRIGENHMKLEKVSYSLFLPLI